MVVTHFCDVVLMYDSPSRSYDWAGLRSERGLVPHALRRSAQSHLRRSHMSHAETNPCHHSPLWYRLLLALSSISGMDVHKDWITIAVLPAAARTPTRLERLPNDLPKLKKWLARVAREGRGARVL